MKKLPDEVYWRYKKNTPPVDDNAHLNGAVTVRKYELLPNPLKCSKCEYVAKTVFDSKQHWIEHD